MTKLPFNIKYLENAPDIKVSLPRKGDLGIDFFAAEDVFIPLNKAAKIKLGVSVQVPYGYGLVFNDRSSMSNYTHVLGGVLDVAVYTGEFILNLYCHAARDTNETLGAGIQIKRNQKVVQGRIVPDLNSLFELHEVSELAPTERGEGGFGSTGS